MKQGHLFIISGPSGVGKDTIGDGIVKTLNDKIEKLPTFTTRKPRSDERNGREYFFVTKKEFEKLINNEETLEYNFYNNNYYGSSKTKINQKLDSGKNILLVVDVNGALSIKKAYPKTITIFIESNLKDIESRLRNRKQNTESEITDRLEIAQKELKIKNKYDYQVKNPQGNPKIAIDRVAKIIQDVIQ